MKKIIAVDFDGTLCQNLYPQIGYPNKKIIQALKLAQTNGAKIILWTCRSGKQLADAICWCRDRGIYFDAINDNLPELVKKYGNNSRKIWATEYWDDRSIRMGELLKQE